LSSSCDFFSYSLFASCQISWTSSCRSTGRYRTRRPRVQMSLIRRCRPYREDPVAVVLLSGFRRHSPQQWFIHAEAIFQTNRVRSDLVKPRARRPRRRRRSHHIGPTPGIQYSLVTHRLINAYSIPQATRFRTIVQPGGTGGSPAILQMLRDVRSALPDGIGDVEL